MSLFLHRPLPVSRFQVLSQPFLCPLERPREFGFLFRHPVLQLRPADLQRIVLFVERLFDRRLVRLLQRSKLLCEGRIQAFLQRGDVRPVPCFQLRHFPLVFERFPLEDRRPLRFRSKPFCAECFSGLFQSRPRATFVVSQCPEQNVLHLPSLLSSDIHAAVDIVQEVGNLS